VTTARAWRIEGAFGLDRLAQVSLDEPRPGPGQVLVRVRAVALNYRDLLVIQGLYDRRLRLPHVPCSDAAGEVIELGAGVTRVKVGDRVTSSFAQAWTAGRPTIEKLRSALGGPLPGVLATHVVLEEDGVALAPPHLTDVEACTLPCAALTAWHALVDHGRLVAGETVLVQGTGGVSIFALQIARMHGARVIATSSKPEKRARLEAMGALATIDYAADAEWGKTARAKSGGAGVDHVVEVGGAGTMAQSLRAVAPGGCVHVIGVLSGGEEGISVLPVLMNEVRLQGIMVGPRESLEAMGRALAHNDVHPVIDRVFPWGDVPAALAHLRSGAHFGKVCVEVP
jgi:NADPH:quinone reductase-like Zn-dependent oxidoreductase